MSFVPAPRDRDRRPQITGFGGSPLLDPRIRAYLGITLVIVLVNDGWSGRPNGIAHQLLLLPLIVQPELGQVSAA
ncbi:MAG: hypothetical protein ACRYFU_19925 [Janthinobacterium lividum]